MHRKGDPTIFKEEFGFPTAKGHEVWAQYVTDYFVEANIGERVSSTKYVRQYPSFYRILLY